MEGGQFGSFGVGFVCLFLLCSFFFFSLCNDAPKANLDGVAERSWGMGVRSGGLLCCKGAD